MISVITTRTGTDNATAGRFSPIQTNQAQTPGTLEANSRSVMVDSGTFQNWFLKRAAAPGVGTSITYTILKNNVATGMTATISDAGTTAQDTTNTFSYAAGDVISVTITPTGTVTTASVSWSIEIDATGQPLLSGDVGSLVNTAANYLGLQASTQTATTTSVGSIMPTAGTIDNAYMDTSVAPGAAKTWTATLVKNGVDTSLVMSVTGGAGNTAGNDTNGAHAVSVVAGDSLYWRVDPTSTPAAGRIRVSCRFTPTVDGESIQTFGSTANLATSGNNFSTTMFGTLVYSTAETSRATWLGSAFDAKKLYVDMDTGTGASDSWVFTLRSNLANTSLAATVSGNGVKTANNTGTTVTPTTGAYIAVNTVGATTPTAQPTRWSYVTYRAPAGGAATPARKLALLGVG